MGGIYEVYIKILLFAIVSKWEIGKDDPKKKINAQHKIMLTKPRIFCIRKSHIRTSSYVTSYIICEIYVKIDLFYEDFTTIIIRRGMLPGIYANYIDHTY